MTTFEEYGNCLLQSVKDNPKIQDFAEKKNEIIDGVIDYYKLDYDLSVLFVGFNPAIISSSFNNVTVTCVDTETLEWLQQKNSKIKYIDFANGYANHNWDIVVAVDEYFTYADSDDAQKMAIKKICSLANELVISTLKDYKNLDFKDKEFSQPAVLRNDGNFCVFTEFHDWDYKERSRWQTYVYMNGCGTKQYGPFERRTMYFKQLAKFSIDSGASSFLVHKNLMFKGLIKKNYEHVVSIRFRDEY